MRASTSPLPPGCRCTSGQRLAGPTHLRQLAVGILQVGHPCRLRADGQHLLLQALVLLLHTAGRPSASWERLVRLGACCGIDGMTWHQRMQHFEPGWPCMTSPAHGAQAWCLQPSAETAVLGRNAAKIPGNTKKMVENTAAAQGCLPTTCLLQFGSIRLSAVSSVWNSPCSRILRPGIWGCRPQAAGRISCSVELRSAQASTGLGLW